MGRSRRIILALCLILGLTSQLCSADPVYKKRYNQETNRGDWVIDATASGLLTASDLTDYVPYTGATTDVDLGAHSLFLDVNEILQIGSYTLTNDATDFIMDDSLVVGSSGQSIIASGLVVNENGGATASDDFRVESDSVSPALVVDASADTLTINVASDINGALVRADGTIVPVSLADASAANNSIYYSTTQSKLVYKDAGGTVNDLY